MKKSKPGKYVKRDSSTGKFVVAKNDGRTVTAKFKGVSVTAPSARVARTKARGVVRYNSNVGFFLENDRNESDSAISITSKTQSSLEDKYRNIRSK